MSVGCEYIDFGMAIFLQDAPYIVPSSDSAQLRLYIYYPLPRAVDDNCTFIGLSIFITGVIDGRCAIYLKATLGVEWVCLRVCRYVLVT
jgi:hypothetical protein